MIQIQVSYSKLDNLNFTEGQISALRRLELVITQNALRLFNSTSNYHWECDPEDASYFRLIKTLGGIVVASQPASYFSKCTHEEFLAILEACKRRIRLQVEESHRERSSRGMG